MKTTRIEWKIVRILLLATALPLLVSSILVRQVIRESLAIGLNPQVRAQLDETLALYAEYFRAVRRGYEQTADAIARSHALQVALLRDREQPDPQAIRTVLRREIEARPEIQTIVVRTAVRGSAGVPPSGPIEPIGVERSEPFPLRPERYRSLNVERPLEATATDGPASSGRGVLSVTFSTSIEPFERFERAGEMVRTYRQIEGAGGKLLRYYTLVFVGIVGAVIVLVTLAGIGLSRRITRRLAVLTAATRSVGAGNLDVEVRVVGGDEVAELLASFNTMVRELRDNRERIEYLQKISAWQEMARRLAHEIKNPLTPIQLAIQQLREKYAGQDPEFRKLLAQSSEVIEEEVEGLRRLTEEFSTFAKLPGVRTEAADLNEYVSESLQGARLLGESAAGGVEIAWEPSAEPLPVSIDRLLFKRAIDNLARNAVEATAIKHPTGSGRVRIVTQADRATGHALLRVIDNGPGVPDNLRDAIFDPYVTTKEAGTGLGLAIVKKVVLEHGGTVAVRSTAEGAEFIIWLPLRPGAVLATAKGNA